MTARDSRDQPDVAAMLAGVEEVAAFCAANAGAIDEDGAFPAAEFGRVADAGLLAAPLLPEWGGLGVGTAPGCTLPALRLLKTLGRGNLAVGRLYEGHLNALQLIQLFGRPEQVARYAADAREGRLLFGVWNTQGPDGVRLLPLGGGRYRLAGAKVFTSGAGNVGRAIVTGALPDGGWQICVVPAAETPIAIDRSGWRPLGMRASASYRVDFDGVEVGPDDLLGAAGDYYRQPWFSGGVIRFAAAQLGGAEALFDAARAELRALGRTGDPFQQARIGEAAIAIEGGNLWLGGAAAVWDGHAAAFRSLPPAPEGETAAVVAYANMTRTAIERVCLQVIEIVERSIGMRGLLRPHPIERIVRDLSLYLRQPAPDAALVNAGAWALAMPEEASLRPGAS